MTQDVDVTVSFKKILITSILVSCVFASYAGWLLNEKKELESENQRLSEKITEECQK